MNLVDISNVSDFCALRRPHFRLEGNALYFLASQRPYRILSSDETQVWDAIEHPLAIRVLRDRFPAFADHVIQDFWSSELCELLEPAFPETRRRVLVIEPHPDDAALSLGGVMWLRRHECAFIVATMASRTNFTSYYYVERDYFDVEKVTEIRRKESALFVQMIGGTHVAVGLTDAALRYRDTHWSSDFFRRHRVSIAAATSRSANREEYERWTKAVRQLLAQTPSHEVWIPLGAPHTDHRATANACLAVFLSNPSLVMDRVIRMYQEVPYAARSPAYTAEVLAALKRTGAELEPEPIPIDGAFDQKLRLVSLYSSQFKMRVMRLDIEASSFAYGSKGHAELLWKVRRMPDHIDPLGISAESTVALRQEEAAAWVLRNRNSERVRVLLLVPTGRWADDLRLLCASFPQARFEIFMAPAAAAEVTDASCDRILAHRAGSGKLAWCILSLRLAAAKPMPTLFHVGEARLRAAKWLSKLWVRSDSLVVASMNQVVPALNLQTSQEKGGCKMGPLT
jgi:LmbE family N-acetylglucosaminyl deacetylase